MITSSNNFPTQSGLASSSSGLCALAICLNDLLQQVTSSCSSHSLMEMCRLGSGSSIRSIFPGIADWQGLFTNPPFLSELQQMGILPSHLDPLNLSVPDFDTVISALNDPVHYDALKTFSFSRFVSSPWPTSHLRDKLHVLILCSSFDAKKTGSTAGMQDSVKTSSLLKSKAINYKEQQA